MTKPIFPSLPQTMRTVEDADLKGKRVLLLVDYNTKELGEETQLSGDGLARAKADLRDVRRNLDKMDVEVQGQLIQKLTAELDRASNELVSAKNATKQRDCDMAAGNNASAPVTAEPVHKSAPSVEKLDSACGELKTSDTARRSVMKELASVTEKLGGKGSGKGGDEASGKGDGKGSGKPSDEAADEAAKKEINIDDGTLKHNKKPSAPSTGRHVFKIDQTLPTIEYILEKTPYVLFILTHLGRPTESFKDAHRSFSTEPLYEYLKEKLNKDEVSTEITFVEVMKYLEEDGTAPTMIGNKVLFGDNLRYYPQDVLETFYGKFDVIVNDAFGSSHRPAPFKAYAGFLMRDEIEALKSAAQSDLTIIGGAKASEKLRVAQKVPGQVFLAGLLATSAYKQQGYEIGEKTKYEEIEGLDELGGRAVLPEDFKVINKDGVYEDRKIGEIVKTDTVIDVGTRSIEKLEQLVEEAKVVLWNGPLGKFEDDRAGATRRLIEKLSRGPAKVILGGGETLSALFRVLGPGFRPERTDGGIFHISTGGGAMLSFLEGERMPGVASVCDDE